MKTVTPQGYLPRVVDAEIEECLRLYGAVEVTGAKWCGKTWTARHHAQSIAYLDDPNSLEMAQSAPELLLDGDHPRVIDEWQLAPHLWDTVRHAVDDAGKRRGLWILTGSSAPDYSATRHSGAGRIGRVRMSSMTLFESGDSLGAISLSGLFAGNFTPCRSEVSPNNLAAWCTRGGWPGVIRQAPREALRVARDYLKSITTTNVPTKGKNADTTMRLMRALAKNLGQAATYKTLANDMYGSEDAPEKPTPRTIGEYVTMLDDFFLIEQLPGWAPPARSPKRFQTKEKRYFTDPSLAVALLGMNQESMLRDFQTFGLVFENLCLRDLAVYAAALPEAADSPLRYYRDDTGLEADAIIEQADGSWAGIEIKLGANKTDQAAANLLRLKQKLTQNPLTQTREPAFLAVIVGLGEYAFQRPDGVYVIPINALAP
ncbi:ATP-binding protein [Mobiluncus mulieris]|uniref:ATP-binding protein n=1 Tax=Mobiluncus mulieris TaxID=2052 RepID=UPI0014704774|nr:DUF4143 domain-containing protein [Mobiluncus mulieris]MCV0009847.1 ATP-binding protein [Mobiluncus mulieris]NMX02179.1 ATP-binding protein [Mobiluncus mulieris]NMX20647.1 ATP-binding protein [Mobiluncus mulieris]